MSYFDEGSANDDQDYSPGQRLLASVLEAAVTDYARAGGGYLVRKHRENARRWIFGSPLPGTGLDFELVCEALRLDPAQVRRLVLENRVRMFPARVSRSTVEVDDESAALAAAG